MGKNIMAAIKGNDFHMVLLPYGEKWEGENYDYSCNVSLVGFIIAPLSLFSALQSLQ
jgi:hypothetical protein